MSTFITIGFDIYYQFYPLYLFSKWQVNTLDIALATMVLSSAIVVMQLFIINLCNKLFKSEHTIIVFSILYCICISSLLFINAYSVVIVIFCLLGFCIGIIGTNLPVLVSDLTDKNIQGQIMGLMMSLRFLGDGIMCLLGGIVSSFSVNTPFIIASIFVMVGILMFVIISYHVSFRIRHISAQVES